jgi:glucose-6-phosphate dehydrogenase assembly protein OpcA
MALTFETIVIDVGSDHLEHLDSIVDPLIATDLTTLVWAPHGHWDGVEALRRISHCVLLDSTEEPDVAVALRRAASLLESRAVVDLAWLRSTPWRERIATIFDPPSQRARLREITGLAVRHHPVSGSSALLLCGWLASRLGWPASPLRHERLGHAEGELGDVFVALDSTPQEVPGLSGLTLTLHDDCELSLDRGPGGLHASQRDSTGAVRTWRLLGASRGEGGILGEGIRQSLLSDHIYGEALRCASALLA